MQIPAAGSDREDFYDEIVKQCEKSQDVRKVSYEKNRAFYLSGSDDETPNVPFNKIYPHLDTVTSFLFSSETTRFSVLPDAAEPITESYRSSVFGDALNELWHNSNTDIVVSAAITWALVYNSMFVKAVPRVNPKTRMLQINPFTVHPACMGVYREDVNTLDRQQAIVQTYYTTEDELKRRLTGHPEKDTILSMMAPAQTEDQRASRGINKLLMGSWQPLGNPQVATGGLSFNMSSDMGYRPEQLDKLRALKELWIWDDDLNDYRVVTRPESGNFSIYDQANFYLPGEHPFIQLCPRPLPFYVWGESEVNGLIGLQEWRNEYIEQIRKLLKLQVTPPTAMFGMGIVEEQAYAKFIEGSFISDSMSGMPNPKVERYSPSLPQDVYRMIGEIDNAFNEYSGLPNTVQGKGDVGVRSGKQADSLARLGASRIKKRALVIEDSLEKLAHLYAQLMQKHDATKYKDSQNNVFVLNQFTKHYNVKVDSHSNSPVFVEDKRELAFSMLNAGMITKARAIDMIDPPDKQMILRELPQIEKNQAAGAQAAQEAELKKEALKHAPEGFIQRLLAKFFPQ